MVLYETFNIAYKMEVIMKNVWKKNQIIVTALVIMLAVAGYLNLTDQTMDDTLEWANLTETESGDTEETSQGNVEVVEKENDVKEELIDEETENEQVGEAVLTSADGNNIYYSLKLTREQTRAENKEMLTEIINNANATETQKNDAINSIMEIAEISEKENAAETLLSAKGFSESLVSMDGNQVDVVINQANLTEQEIIQIEDIVKRKTEVAVENIVISTANQ